MSGNFFERKLFLLFHNNYLYYIINNNKRRVIDNTGHGAITCLFMFQQKKNQIQVLFFKVGLGFTFLDSIGWHWDWL